MAGLPSIEKGKYLHTKSAKLYEVIGVALQTESSEALVIYRPLYDNPENELYARPYGIFFSDAEIDGKIQPRFQKVTPSKTFIV